ncbi:MAG TPA: ATP-binding protein [Bryobacteraceae bacterium]|nr:ATP-binding protein [Bryobacteraceae bacterium]
MTWRFSRLSLLTKLLLSTSVAVTVLFALTGELVLGRLTQTMSDSLEAEVQNGFQAYSSLFHSRAELLSSVSRLLASMADVRSVLSTGDRATIENTAGELWANVADSSAIFLVTDPDGKVIASLGGATNNPLDRDLMVVQEAAKRFPEQSTGFLLQKGEMYQISVIPVYVDSSHGSALFKVFVAGYHVDATVVQQLKQRTNSDFVVTTPGRVVVSTLNPRATDTVVHAIERDPNAERISDGVTQYARLVTPLQDISGRPVGAICILRSFEGAQKIARLYTLIVLIWALAVSFGLGLTYLMARRIIAPVKQLDLAAAEVAHQNYAIEVPVTSDDEMGRLARTFNNMCASIRQAREDLIRQERISTIGRLSGSIVHDLRNPLAAIYGGAEMLVDGDLPPAHVKRLAGNIYRASRRIQEMLQDLVNVSRGKTTAPEMCRLREVALSACDSLGAAAENQGVRVEVSIPPEIEVPLDRSRMERAFVNLIGNALEAMPGGGEVRISAVLERSSVVVQVADNGPGIAPEIRSSLFQPFVTARKRNGLGLGLALTRQTVLEHGGDMWVESEVGGGARFKFRLPGAQVSQVLHV